MILKIYFDFLKEINNYGGVENFNYESNKSFQRY